MLTTLLLFGRGITGEDLGGGGGRGEGDEGTDVMVDERDRDCATSCPLDLSIGDTIGDVC